MKKKIIFGVMMLLATVYCSSIMAYSGGTGSEKSPFLISSNADWKQLTDKVNESEGTKYSNVHFLLTRDLTGITTTIGVRGAIFGGVFDGGGHKVTVNIEPDENTPWGSVFGEVQNATIKNLTVDGKISGSHVGGICKEGFGTIRNCYNSAEIRGDYAGGICGKFIGNIIDCHNSGDVSGNYAGGICGEFNGNVIYCSNRGKVRGSKATGGICGEFRGNITKSYNMGEIVSYRGKDRYHSSNDKGWSGGIAGSFTRMTPNEISNCFNIGKITATGVGFLTGGICGGVWDYCGVSENECSINISNCYNGGNIVVNGIEDDASWAMAGSICGSPTIGVITNCFSIARGVEGNTTRSYVGRIVGYIAPRDEVRIENCYAYPSMTLNGETVSSSDPTSNNGQDQTLDAFTSKEWLEKNLKWDFEIWGFGGAFAKDLEYRYPIIK